jgi:hypothetical protein
VGTTEEKVATIGGSEDASEPTGEARVVQKLTNECRSRSKDFEPTTKPKITVDTVEEGGGNR